MSELQKSEPGYLRKVFSTTNSYTDGLFSPEIITREEMYAKKSIFTGLWNVYKLCSQVTYAQLRGGAPERVRLVPEKVASDVTFDTALETLRAHEENAQGLQMSLNKTVCPNKRYWRDFVR